MHYIVSNNTIALYQNKRKSESRDREDRKQAGIHDRQAFTHQRPFFLVRDNAAGGPGTCGSGPFHRKIF
jgi:hypothetical protein